MSAGTSTRGPFAYISRPVCLRYRRKHRFAAHLIVCMQDHATGKQVQREELTAALRDAWERMLVRDVATAGGIADRQVGETQEGLPTHQWLSRGLSMCDFIALVF